ncbi:hypothetical protein QR680_010222 [Steinernema hermaphroditum]|uniref:F-box domain-containing protein n=1 Tax=Steinernema hermaphroditum TaxID=289476 RepID=A0AA39IN77_9BILA|nr:hypothetical protein QR680_010222 [Steinernema hermaphroditum]
MDCLPSDLIDHLVHFLPMADVKTIIKATAGSADLAAWNEVAEDHLRERFVLHLSVYLPCNDDEEESEDSADSEYDEGDHYNDAPEDEYDEDEQYYIPPKRPRLEDKKKKEGKKPAPFLISVNKSWFGGRRPIGQWNFKNWRYAWLGRVRFHSYQPDQNELYQPYELQDILRIISLPVSTRSGTRSRSVLSLERIKPTEMDSALNMLNVLQKTFTQMKFENCWDGLDLKVEEFLSDYLDRETSLEYLCFQMRKYNSSTKQALADRIVAFFNKKKSVNVLTSKGMISDAQGEKIIEHWLNSDGFSQGCKEFRRFSKPWNLNRGHAPVTMKWMDALIEKWKKCGGLYTCKRMRLFELLLEKQEWYKLLAKNGHRAWISTLSIKHPSGFWTLDMWNQSERSVVIVCEMQHNLNEAVMKTLLAKWEKGSGEFVVDQFRRIVINMDYRTLFSATRPHTITDYPVFFAHPVVNARLKIDRQRSTRNGDPFRFSVVPIDTEAVEDWNLDRLFELR